MYIYKVMEKQRYLIGGAKMVELGSDRSTSDTDYLIYDENLPLFSSEGNTDFINAAKNDFYKEIHKLVEITGVTPGLMFEMKAYSLVQHLQNMNFNKVATTEYDMRRLYLDYNVKEAPVCEKFVTKGEYQEILNTLIF